MLKVDHNRLTTLHHIMGLKGICVLNVGHNELESLQGLGKLTSLKVLIANNNKLTELKMPATLCDLNTLVASNNQITTVDGALSLDYFPIFNPRFALATRFGDRRRRPAAHGRCGGRASAAVSAQEALAGAQPLAYCCGHAQECAACRAQAQWQPHRRGTKKNENCIAEAQTKKRNCIAEAQKKRKLHRRGMQK